jgi:putative pyoverdin transport system ATP-binding/permease protein
MAGLSGMTNALLLAIINAAADAPTSEDGNLRLVLLFMATMGIFIVAQNYILSRSTRLVQTLLNNIRLKILDQLLHAELSRLESVSKARIFAGFSTETLTISQSATTITIAAQAGIMVAFSMIYLAILSRPAFFLTIGFTFVGTLTYLRISRDIQSEMQLAFRNEHGFLGMLAQVMDGFKQVKLHRLRAEALGNALRSTSRSIAELRILANNKFNGHYTFSQCVFYMLIASVVFLLPRFNEPSSEVLRKVTATILFITTPLTSLIAAVPVVSSANAAVDSIVNLERELARAEDHHGNDEPYVPRDGFSEIRLEQVAFRYGETGDSAEFSLGPLNLDIRSGEILFIVGGNGSGKSTLMKLLTALYYPQSGRVLLDGVPLSEMNYQAYRSLFTVIFTDYHIFDRLYGLSGYSPQQVADFLQLYRLQDQTALVEDCWETTELSTGQRKRLALIVSHLENRPIYVMDEWAADQDPLFRRYFYEVILPDLKRQGKTVIAATHDDRYFYIADRVLAMDFGQISPFSDKNNINGREAGV